MSRQETTSRSSPIELSQPPGAVTQTIQRDADAIEHGKIEVVERLRVDLEMPAGFDGATPLTGHHDRKVVVIMTVTIADPAAVDNHRAVKQRARALPNRLELAQQIGELLDVKSIDDLELLVLLDVASVVRQVMVPVCDVNGG